MAFTEGVFGAALEPDAVTRPGVETGVGGGAGVGVARPGERSSFVTAGMVLTVPVACLALRATGVLKSVPGIGGEAIIEETLAAIAAAATRSWIILRTEARSDSKGVVVIGRSGSTGPA